MDGKIIEINEDKVKDHLGKFVRDTVEETLNAMLEAEADQLCNAQRHERNTDRQGYRAGHYERTLLTKAGEVKLQVPKLKKVTFETAIIERYKRREISVEEAMVEMYLAGVSVRRVEDITEALWGTKVSPGTISNLNKKIYEEIEKWRNLPIHNRYTYVYLDGIWMKRTWGGEVRNVSVLVAIGVNEDGFREIIGVAEGTKEDKDSWQRFLRYLKNRGLNEVKLFISDKSLGLVESIPEFFPEAKWQRCVVHFYRNVFSFVPRGKVKEVATMLKAIHAQENREEAIKKKDQIAEKLSKMKLHKASELVKEGSIETFSFYHFPVEHWKRIRT
ncbi:MAG: IS256 family transposase, partial [Kosmotogaceae bacterium]|nr:IS256 family transposase [Kosmotogaceae bacterium]